MTMDKLNYEVLKRSGYEGYILPEAPEKVLQFGEGNFLRAFANYWFDVANERVGWNGKCVLVQPIKSGLAQMINEQQGLYTLYLRGRENGEKVDRKRVISVVSRCLNPYEEADFSAMMEVARSKDLEYVVSNTTEAGIVYDPACQLHDRPASSFPGKLTQVLLERHAAGRPGLVILSCELIDNNGKELLKCVNQYIDQWGLDEDFRRWVNEECTFCSTLVDRIVPGRIRDPEEVARLEQEHGYSDPLLDVGEVFGVWNIEGPAWLEEKLPFKAAGLNCPVVPDVTPYKKRKVRILNGAHNMATNLSGEVEYCYNPKKVELKPLAPKSFMGYRRPDGRALEVIRAIQSPNLRIIFDPVNLLCPENAADRETIFAETMDRLAEHIAVVHIKDFVPAGTELKSVAAGEGEMDYRSILRFLKARKPYIQATLENTSNKNAVRSRQLIQRLYEEL